MRSQKDAVARAVAWRMLADLLEVHAEAEEEILYPVLLKRGSGHAPADTTDAIGDRNQIRDAITSEARGAPGTAFRRASVQASRKANDEHLPEDEPDVIPDLRMHTGPGFRCELGVRWMTFHCEHRAARGISRDDVDPAGSSVRTRESTTLRANFAAVEVEFR